MKGILFDQYQRYKKVEAIISQISENGKLKILEVGANEHKNLEKFLPNAQIQYLDIHLPDDLLKDKNYILGDATDMPFIKDDAYDVVIALDVFEHISEEKRNDFINEIARVSNKCFIMTAPFGTYEVQQAEQRCNEYFKILQGEDHPWIKEHIENGLPDLSKLKKYLDQKEIRYRCEGYGKISLWEKMLQMHFLSIKYPELLNYITYINDYYNEKVYNLDYEGACYRHVVVGAKEASALDIQYLALNIPKKQEVQMYLKHLDTFIEDTFKLVNIVGASRDSSSKEEQLLLKQNHISNLEAMSLSLKKELGLKESHIQNLEKIKEASGMKDDQIDRLQKELELKEGHIQNLEQIKEASGVKDEMINRLKEELELKESHIQNLEQIKEASGVKDDQIDRLQKELGLKESHIQNLEQIKKASSVKDEMIDRLQKELGLKESHIQNLEQIEKASSVKDEMINRLQKELELKESHMQNLEQIKKASSIKDDVINSLQKELELKEQLVHDLEISRKNLLSEIEEYNTTLNSVREDLLRKKEEIEAIYGTALGKLFKRRIMRK